MHADRMMLLGRVVHHKDAGHVDPHDLHVHLVRRNGQDELPLVPRGREADVGQTIDRCGTG